MKPLYIYCFVFFIYLVLFSCNIPKKQEAKTQDSSSFEADLKALTLLQNNCFNCHSPESSSGVRVAPPMFKVRNHYFDDKTSIDEFVNNIIHFVNNPTAENSIMPGAVRNFGLMPKQSFKEDDLKLIAQYIYNNDLESDEWYAKWEEFKTSEIPQQHSLSYEDLGLNIANGTKSQLGKNLLEAIKNRGAAGAVEFCNTRAIALTDSMANVFQAEIKRVSDKPRNPLNIADEAELAYINELKNKLLNGEKLLPKVAEKGDKIIAYYAIETNKMCLQCHGKKDNDILPETYSAINKLYPNDKATGYAENQLRGIWVVEMVKK